MIDLDWSVSCKSVTKLKKNDDGGGELLTYFPTFVSELTNDKIPNALCLVKGKPWGC